MIIDLSVLLNSDTPVYPGDPNVKIERAGVISRDGFCDHSLSLNTHVGTHIDAPMHMVEGGKSLDEFSPNRFIGRGKYIEVKNLEFSLDDVKDADIQEGDIVLFHTGLSKKYDKPDEYFEQYPDIPESIAEYLVQQKVSMVGVDMCGPDHPEFPVHKILLSNDVLIIENLTNLDQLDNKEFRVIALPLKLDIDGSPARVVAELK